MSGETQNRTSLDLFSDSLSPAPSDVGAPPESDAKAYLAWRKRKMASYVTEAREAHRRLDTIAHDTDH